MILLDFKKICFAFFWNFWVKPKPNAIAYLLWPLSQIFSAITHFRRVAFARKYLSSWQSPVPLIIVGNLSVGGNGKTPIVLAIAKVLVAKGLFPGIISRGYATKFICPTPKNIAREVNSKDNPDLVGDEPLMMARSLLLLKAKVPIFISKKRAIASQTLLKNYPKTNIIISDDGLQHYALARTKKDIEIVVIDYKALGNGFLLPAGPLREATNRGRNFTLLTSNPTIKQKCVSETTFSTPLVLQGFAWNLNQVKIRKDLKKFCKYRSNTILMAAGIAYPKKFFTSLNNIGIYGSHLELPDHFDFAINPFDKFKAAQIILITEKDAVKCANFQDSRIWVVPVEAKLSEQFIKKLLLAINYKQS